MGMLLPNMGNRQPYLGRQAGLPALHLGSMVACMDSNSFARAVAENVEKAIDRSGLSLLAAAKKAGIPYTTLDRRIKSGGLSPFTVREVKAIADALGRTANDLLTVYVTVEKVPA